MGALIIIHGLFLIHCNSQMVASTDGLPPQMCEILAIQNSLHEYEALGANSYQTLPDETSLQVTLATTGSKNPNRNGLSQRVLLLNQMTDHVLAGATTRIVTPIPDDIYAANAVYPKLSDLLNGTSPNVVSSPTVGNGLVRISETTVLSYQNAGAFTLTDGQGFTVNSQAFGSYNAIALFAWPASMTSTANCNEPFDHPAMNSLIDIGGGQHPNIKFLQLVLTDYGTMDDSPVSNWGLSDQFLRPPCIHPITKTAVKTGCSSEVLVD
jgi:hypothetical protein